MPTSHRIVTIPKLSDKATSDSQMIALAHKFRRFRLFALQESPGAFASSYEEEADRGLDQTFDRLRSTKATQFVALADDTAMQADDVRETEVQDLMDNDWVGFIVLIRLQNSSDGISAKSDPIDQIAQDKSQMCDAGKPLRFHLNGMFVHPSARRAGLGKRLIRAALEKARAESTSHDRDFACTIIVDEWNASARTLYQRCGFQVLAKEIYGEDRVALRMELQEARMRRGG